MKKRHSKKGTKKELKGLLKSSKEDVSTMERSKLKSERRRSVSIEEVSTTEHSKLKSDKISAPEEDISMMGSSKIKSDMARSTTQEDVSMVQSSKVKGDKRRSSKQGISTAPLAARFTGIPTAPRKSRSATSLVSKTGGGGSTYSVCSRPRRPSRSLSDTAVPSSRSAKRRKSTDAGSRMAKTSSIRDSTRTGSLGPSLRSLEDPINRQFSWSIIRLQDAFQVSTGRTGALFFSEDGNNSQVPSTSEGTSASTPSTSSKSKPSSLSTDRSSSGKRRRSISAAPRTSTANLVPSGRRRSRKGNGVSTGPSSMESSVSYRKKPSAVRRKTYVKEPGEDTFSIRDDKPGAAIRSTSRATIIFDNKEAEVENTTIVPIAIFPESPVRRKSISSGMPEPELPPRSIQAPSKIKVPALGSQVRVSSKSDSELTINIRVIYKNSQGSETSLTSAVRARVNADEKSNLKEHLRKAIAQKPPKAISDMTLPSKGMPPRRDAAEESVEPSESKLKPAEPKYNTARKLRKEVRKPEAQEESPEGCAEQELSKPFVAEESDSQRDRRRSTTGESMTPSQQRKGPSQSPITSATKPMAKAVPTSKALEFPSEQDITASLPDDQHQQVKPTAVKGLRRKESTRSVKTLRSESETKARGKRASVSGGTETSLSKADNIKKTTPAKNMASKRKKQPTKTTREDDRSRVSSAVAPDNMHEQSMLSVSKRKGVDSETGIAKAKQRPDLLPTQESLPGDSHEDVSPMATVQKPISFMKPSSKRGTGEMADIKFDEKTEAAEQEKGQRKTTAATKPLGGSIPSENVSHLRDAEGEKSVETLVIEEMEVLTAQLSEKLKKLKEERKKSKQARHPETDADTESPPAPDHTRTTEVTSPEQPTMIPASGKNDGPRGRKQK